MASSVKPEVHNVPQRRQRRTEPRPTRGNAEKFGEDWTPSSGDMLADTQTHIQRHMLILALFNSNTRNLMMFWWLMKGCMGQRFCNAVV